MAEGGALRGPDSAAPRRGWAGFARASVLRKAVGYPAQTRGEVAEWLKAAPC